MGCNMEVHGKAWRACHMRLDNSGRIARGACRHIGLRINQSDNDASFCQQSCQPAAGKPRTEDDDWLDTDSGIGLSQGWRSVCQWRQSGFDRVPGQYHRWPRADALNGQGQKRAVDDMTVTE